MEIFIAALIDRNPEDTKLIIEAVQTLAAENFRLNVDKCMEKVALNLFQLFSPGSLQNIACKQSLYYVINVLIQIL